MAAPIGNFEKSNRLRPLAHRLIPGGAHTYAKGDDQYPVLSPGFIARGLGSHVWDVDGNEYIEYGMGNRSVGLGHAYGPVLEAATRQLQLGCNFTRPASIEVECAETFLATIPGAEMVKFCKDGSDATSGAVRLARAVTGRDIIARCADHPFFSTDDWFIGDTEMNAGIPAAVRNLTVDFRYDDLESVRLLFNRYPGKIAALILEPSRGDDPKNNFLHAVRDICHKNGALVILDEMITGFRWHAGGAQQLYDIQPDFSCFGKALGNGFSISALAGKREYMKLGGLEQTGSPRVFLLSTTHGAETHAMAASIATMRIYQDEPVIDHLYRQGEALRAGIEQVVSRLGLAEFFQVTGRSCCLTYATRDQNKSQSQAFRTLFLQETIKRGVLMPSLVVSYTHSDEDVARTIEAVDGSLGVYKQALENGVENYLVGRPSDVVFRRFNKSPAPVRERELATYD
ncbi:glutamate-1-semialdehyde 2,1-aminomutase [Phyllobacterium endophyticum]|uniref:Glutamate-1-semialdehyde 2,1-aminomutase n=1 Tax=Phyllobacterium endophyticum TaxID=1149773 RepID=A0A2P7B0V9_9HYPH|nr:glutamate-1-semialdehyde 2,1-aminomutase [Phyllobacterium endophyticum]MBB3237640.1 glutamate-1-semialdehyde 2,1-aminomutase [Phyllobacterium endophyticum]PSH60109.1 glutamate-1-semialdehyde 2,1-aminomutase [Phyllobacterium endophyticum]TYR42276.1 glutamate-1-semialdehyde 2,1-aminomutase [Phyllobacterium endophyticum]